jgi:hypothetical protein
LRIRVFIGLTKLGKRRRRRFFDWIKPGAGWNSDFYRACIEKPAQIAENAINRAIQRLEQKDASIIVVFRKVSLYLPPNLQIGKSIGSLAQLVQSICLTSRGSLVRTQ